MHEISSLRFRYKGASAMLFAQFCTNFGSGQAVARSLRLQFGRISQRWFPKRIDRDKMEGSYQQTGRFIG
jgi:hypothetical protein